MTIKAKKSKINLREKLAELLNFRQIRDRLDGLGLYLGKDRTNSERSISIRGSADIDGLHIAEISAVLGGNVVDVFIYDTNNDSDGGKWRERTSHTSWYNEELNTATRGSRREFPAVAVIIAEADKVTIYDADDPDLGMWMVFNASSGKMIWAVQLGCVSSLNARMSIGSPNGSGIRYIDFISDKMREWRTGGVKSVSGDISKRNSGDLARIDIPGQDVIVNQYINDVAMTVLPNAPIDANTGLPVPTIAVATDGGVSVIKDDGSVVDYTCTYSSDNKYSLINFIEGSKLLACSRGGETYPTVFDIPSQDKASFDSTDIVFSANLSDSSSAADIRVGNYSEYKASAVTKENIAMGGASLIISNIDNISGDQTADNVIISSSYNTGWMPGDIKLATLSDTKIEKVGEDESTELIANNDFSSTINENDGIGWELVSGTQSIVGGVLTIQPAAYGGVEQIINVLPNKKYIFNIVVHATTTGTARIYLGDSSSQGAYYNEPSLTAGPYNFEFTTSSDTVLKIKLATTSESGSNVSFSSTSLKQTGELITNGKFDNGTTGWTENNSILEIDSSTGDSRLKITDNGAAASAYQLIKTVAGKKYTATVSASSLDLGDGRFAARDQSVTGTVLNSIDPINLIEDEVLTFNFIAASNDTVIVLGGGSDTGNVAYFDNISVRLAEDDRSVNNNGLQIFGEIDKTPVAPGADLVAYSGFSADNYLMQPYNSDLDFGTGDFCVMGWFKQSPTTDFHTYFDRGNLILVYIDATTSALNFRITDGTTYMNCLSANAVDNDTWTFFVGVKSNGTTYNYINGKLSQTANYAEVGSLDGDFDSYFGVSVNGLRHGDKMALWRVSATIPTDDQIDKIYRDEKVLFQDGTQATLYGTSDAVTALAYDDKTELLHVGTPSGRSDFNGLRRVNNTTTAVTTAISANNKLIAEQ